MNEFQGSYAATAAGIMLSVLLGQKTYTFCKIKLLLIPKNLRFNLQMLTNFIDTIVLILDISAQKLITP